MKNYQSTKASSPWATAFLKVRSRSATSRFLAIALLLPAALLCMGAEGDNSSTGFPATPLKPRLATGFGTSDDRFTYPWDSPGTVNVCFIAPKNTTLDATLEAEASAAIRDSWGAATGLTFLMQGACPATIPTTWISIFLDTKPGNGVAAMGGVGTRFGDSKRSDQEWQDIRTRIEDRKDVQIYVGARPGEYRLQVAHEVGHILGFYHEQERSDHTSDSDPNCALGANTAGHITWFDRNSIMLWSYCTGTQRTDESLMSALDKLGAEMLYPRSYSHSLACSTGCVETGNGVVIRSNGAVTIDWVRRGGVATDPIWHLGLQTYQNADGRLLAAFIPSGSAVTVNFNDAFGRVHVGSGTVIKSDALHTAIIMSASAL